MKILSLEPLLVLQNMQLCVCVCVCVYVYVSVRVCVCVCVHAYVCIYSPPAPGHAALRERVRVCVYDTIQMHHQVTQHGAQSFGGRLDVLLDGEVVRTVQVDAGGIAPTDRRFLVEEAARLGTGRHRLGFRLNGQGSPRWAARFESILASEDLPGETNGLGSRASICTPRRRPSRGSLHPRSPVTGSCAPQPVPSSRRGCSRR